MKLCGMGIVSYYAHGVIRWLLSTKDDPVSNLVDWTVLASIKEGQG